MNALVPVPQMNKGEVFRVLNSNIPLNSYSLPDHIYRADLLDENTLELPPKDRSLVLDAASLPITFEHGYPAINETQPLWNALPSEPEDAYATFTAYLELPEKSNSENPIRLLPLVADLTKRSITQITEWCHMYYWHWRARAYDLFLVAMHRKQREQRIMSIEGYHYAKAEELLNKVTKLADAKLDQELKDLQDDPAAMTDSKVKDLITMAKDLIGIQRVSIGLPAMGPSQFQIQLDGPRHTTAGETFKHIAKEGQGEETPRQRSAEMDALLENPDDLSRVQELLIKLSRPDHVLPAWGSGEIIDVNPNDTDDEGSSGPQRAADARNEGGGNPASHS